MPVEHLADDLDRALDAAPSTRVPRDRVPRELLVPPRAERLLGMAATDWAIAGGAWLGMALGPWWVTPFAVVIVASRIHACGVILHDAAHMPLRSKPGKVRLLEAMCGFPLGTTLEAMRYHHLRHHRDSGMPSDPYFKAGVEEKPGLYALNVLRGLVLLPFWTVRVWFGLAAWASPALRGAYARVFLQDRSGADVGHTPEVAACARAELGQAVFQLAVLAIALVSWKAVVFGYLLPASLTGVLAAWRLLQEHHYVPTNDRRAETILATTRDHHTRHPLAWLLAPRNIGYHVAHHLHPQVGLEHLPAVTAWYRANYPAYGGGT